MNTDQTTSSARGTDEPGLCVLWVSRDRDAALNMGLMYAVNALRHGWWERVRLLVWGPSARLLCRDPELAEAVAELLRLGGEALACRECADRYQTAEPLERMGVTVRYTGQDLTAMLRSGWKVISV